MNQSAATTFVILLALVTANLPFVNQRLFAVLPVPNRTGQKSFWWRAVELVVWYLTVGGVAALLERQLGNPFVQSWQFYTITACLFLVFAAPGFVYQYLRKSHGQ